MAEFNVEKCPVCGETHFTSFLKCTDFFVSKEEFTIKECKSCGFKITTNIEYEANIGNYYQSEEYISHSNTSEGLVNRIYHQVRSYMLGRKRRLVEKAAGFNKGKILDIGTGTGFFINEMKQYGWQVTGTEKSDEARKFSKEEFGLESLPSEDLFQIKEKSFDVITLWHVLEHIHDLDKNLQTLERLLKTNGKLIIAVPNHDSYDAKHYKEFWAAYDVPRHIWHFAPKQMKLLVEKYGFKMQNLHTMPFDSFYVSLLSEKYRKSKLALLKGVFYGKLSWLTSILNKAKCSSVIYVFEKS